MAAKSTSNLAKALTRNELNMLNLVHSALDLSPKLYNFAQWLNSPEFVSPRPTNDKNVQGLPALSVNVPLAFGNYNSQNGMGCGLAALDDIERGTIIIKQKTEMGLVSGNGMLESSWQQEDDHDKDLDDLNNKVEKVTRRVA